MLLYIRLVSFLLMICLHKLLAVQVLGVNNRQTGTDCCCVQLTVLELTKNNRGFMNTLINFWLFSWYWTLQFSMLIIPCTFFGLQIIFCLVLRSYTFFCQNFFTFLCEAHTIITLFYFIIHSILRADFFLIFVWRLLWISCVFWNALGTKMNNFGF